LWQVLNKFALALCRFHIAKDKLAEGKGVVDRIDTIKEFYWPETEELIKETTRQGLEVRTDNAARGGGTAESKTVVVIPNTSWRDRYFRLPLA